MDDSVTLETFDGGCRNFLAVRGVDSGDEVEIDSGLNSYDISKHGASNFKRFDGIGKISSPSPPHEDVVERFKSLGMTGFVGVFISTGEYSISYEGSVGARLDRKITADEGSLNIVVVVVAIGDISKDIM
jgi:hypothetical protein